MLGKYEWMIASTFFQTFAIYASMIDREIFNAVEAEVKKIHFVPCMYSFASCDWQLSSIFHREKNQSRL